MTFLVHSINLFFFFFLILGLYHKTKKRIDTLKYKKITTLIPRFLPCAGIHVTARQGDQLSTQTCWRVVTRLVFYLRGTCSSSTLLVLFLRMVLLSVSNSNEPQQMLKVMSNGNQFSILWRSVWKNTTLKIYYEYFTRCLGKKNIFIPNKANLEREEHEVNPALGKTRKSYKNC